MSFQFNAKALRGATVLDKTERGILITDDYIITTNGVAIYKCENSFGLDYEVNDKKLPCITLFVTGVIPPKGDLCEYDEVAEVLKVFDKNGAFVAALPARHSEKDELPDGVLKACSISHGELLAISVNTAMLKLVCDVFGSKSTIDVMFSPSTRMVKCVPFANSPKRESMDCPEVYFLQNQ